MLSNNSLTISQQQIHMLGLQYLETNKGIIIVGANDMGKHTVAHNIMCSKGNYKELNIDDLQRSDMDTFVKGSLNYSLVTNKANENYYLDDKQGKHRKLTTESDKASFVYIRRLDLLLKELSEYKQKIVLANVKKMLNELPIDVKCIITSAVPFQFPNVLCIELGLSMADLAYLLSKTNFSQDTIDMICGVGCLSSLGETIHQLQKACYINDGRSYAKAKNIQNDLIGLIDTKIYLQTHFIMPFTTRNEFCKTGCVICGPSGTGKTAIGKWLSRNIPVHFIKGNTVSDIVKELCACPTGIAFIDEGDFIFTNENARDFALCLDNFNGKVAVIVTCTSLSKIPRNLIRGGRLENVILTKLPNKEEIANFLRIQIYVLHYNLTGETLNSDLLTTLSEKLASKMLEFNYADIKQCVQSAIYDSHFTGNKDIVANFDRYIKEIYQQREFDKIGSYMS